MEPLPILPANIWPGPIPGSDTPEYATYQEFILAYSGEQITWPEEQDENVTLRSLSYDCITEGTDTKVGHIVSSRIRYEEDDGHWGGNPSSFSTTKDSWGLTWSTVVGALPSMALPPSENLPLALDIEDSDQTAFNPGSEPILQAQSTTYYPDHSFYLFLNVEVPPSAKINYAYIRFVSDGVYSGLEPRMVGAYIGAEDTSNASDTPSSISEASALASRLTNTRQHWSQSNEDWNVGQAYETTNIACVIQNIIDKGGWQSGNGIQLVLMGDATGGTATGGDYLYAKGFTDGTANAPTLYVYYEAPPANITMQGGVIAQARDRVVMLSGTAVVSKQSNIISNGRIKLSGLSPNSNSREFDEAMSGGMKLSGNGTNYKFSDIQISGGSQIGGMASSWMSLSGAICGGLADVQMVFDATRLTNEVEVIANSDNYQVRCWFYLDENTNILHYRFSHTAVPITAILLHGPAAYFEDAPALVYLAGPYTSPMQGAFGAPQYGIDFFKAGQIYVLIHTATESLRAQIQLPGWLGGEADVANHILPFEVEGAGLVIEGTSDQFTIRNARMYLGIKLSGNAETSHTNTSPRIKGGVRASGLATVSIHYKPVPIGGAKGNGRVQTLKTISETMAGGVFVDKQNQTIIHVAIGSSGIVLGGTTIADRTMWPPMQGGVVIDSTIHSQFTDYVDGHVGVRLSGKSTTSYEKFYQSFRSGYCRAMASENICTTPPARTDILITSDISPILEDHLPTLESAGWCDVVERCSLGVLPKIVQSRQGVHLPSKEPVRRKTTSLTQKSTVHYQ